MGGIFISYRREDSADVSGRIYDHLAARYGKSAVFKDVDGIPYGEDFALFLQGKLRECSIVLALIGPRWLDAATSDGRRRLDDPNDFVRVELETAFRLGLPVVPVLVSRAEMPRMDALPESLIRLVTLNAAPVRPDPDFGTDLKRLSEVLDRFVPPLAPSATPATATARPRGLSRKARRRLVLALAAAVLIAAITAGTLARYNAPTGTMRAFYQADLNFDVQATYALLCPDVQARLPISRLRALADTYASKSGNYDLSHLTFTLLDENVLDASVRVGGYYTYRDFTDNSNHTVTFDQSSLNVHRIEASGLGWCLSKDIIRPDLLT